MDNLWDDAEAARFSGALEQRVYTSRLLGRDKALVMHGGGNTSVKLRELNLFGREEEIVYVKGSGHDLEKIGADGFSPCRMRTLLDLAQLPALSDAEMLNELRQSMTASNAPVPSVEAILHALLPFTYVDHTHADAIIAIANTSDGRARIEEIYGGRVVVIPYVMPGFKLGSLVGKIFPHAASEHTMGMILLNHGIFSFGETARESYDRMIQLVSEAEEYLTRKGAFQINWPEPALPEKCDLVKIAAFRKEVSDAAGSPMIVALHQDAQSLAFAQRPDLADIALQGPLTPDHVIRTKRLPLLGFDLESYIESYRSYFREHANATDEKLTMLDPAPRLVLDPAWGLLTIGKSASDAAITEEIYRHTIDVIARSTLLGGYRALSAAEIFEVEYWDLEQAKLRGKGAPPPFLGEVAFVTGAASGIGRACAEAFLTRGAAVIGFDLDEKIESAFSGHNWLGIAGDVSKEASLRSALEAALRRFGGLDMLVLNAGIFPTAQPIATLSSREWERVMSINLNSNLSLLRESHPFLKLAPKGGRVVVIGSKNVPAPGAGAAAYSASKAALTQLARVAAMEWAADGIRVNVVHPNAVFDTGIWTAEVLASRAASYGQTIEEYKTSNLLKVEVTSRDVGELVATLCGPVFQCTTGAQIPVDGGNDRVV